MEAMARLSRAVIDEVLLHTQEDILIGHDEHVARGIVRDLQQRWERKLSEAQAQRLSDQALLSQTAPGQVIDPDYQTRSSSSSAAANVHHGQASGNTEDNATADGKAEANGNGKEEAAESSGIRALKKRPASKSPPRKVKKTRTDETSEDASLGTSDDDEAEVVTGDPSTDDLLLCQYSKIQNHKGKWKCQFSGGIMHLRGRDYVFRDATGDFRFSEA